MTAIVHLDPAFDTAARDNATAIASGLPAGMPAARKLSHHELSLALLSLLEYAPDHGSALADRLATLSGGFYRPSPGSLYPALAALHRAGRVRVQKHGRRKRYRLSEPGVAYLADQRTAADRTMRRLEKAARKLGALREAMSLVDAHAADGLASDLLQARMDLKAALHDSLGQPAAIQHEIVALLETTAKRIRALSGDDN